VFINTASTTHQKHRLQYLVKEAAAPIQVPELFSSIDNNTVFLFGSAYAVNNLFAKV